MMHLDFAPFFAQRYQYERNGHLKKQQRKFISLKCFPFIELFLILYYIWRILQHIQVEEGHFVVASLSKGAMDDQDGRVKLIFSRSMASFSNYKQKKAFVLTIVAIVFLIAFDNMHRYSC